MNDGDNDNHYMWKLKKKSVRCGIEHDASLCSVHTAQTVFFFLYIGLNIFSVRSFARAPSVNSSDWLPNVPCGTAHVSGFLQCSCQPAVKTSARSSKAME